MLDNEYVRILTILMFSDNNVDFQLLNQPNRIMKIDNLLKIIECSHINFLFGAGLSCPYLKSLGPIEKFLTKAVEWDENPFEQKCVRCNLLQQYFKGVMEPCLPEATGNMQQKNIVINNYRTFLQIVNHIIANRNTNVLDKQINIFTTNIDNFVELAAEATGVEFNDGFKGHLNPIFSEDTFSQILTRVSPLYHTPAAVPVFNYLKIHGSTTWKVIQDDHIGYDSTLTTVRNLSETFKDGIYKEIPLSKQIGEEWEDKSFEEYVHDVKESNLYASDKFLSEYRNLVMINPRKAKFRESVIDNHFYELMRLYSNALEKPNSVLFVAGFSFADEHIAKITLRAANSNPTLQIIVFAYNEKAKHDITRCLLGGKTAINSNIKILSPNEFRTQQGTEKDTQDVFKDLNTFDLRSINTYVFSKIWCKI